MLQSAVRGATKTRLMYEAFLSHSQVEEYLAFLLGKKLISLAPDKKHYTPTEKGRHFLAMFYEIRDAVTVTKPQNTPPKEEAQPLENEEPNGLATPPTQSGERSP